MEGVAKSALRREKNNLTVRVRGDELVVTVMRPMTFWPFFGMFIPSWALIYGGGKSFSVALDQLSPETLRSFLSLIGIFLLGCAALGVALGLFIKKVLQLRTYRFNTRLSSVGADRLLLQWSLRQIEPVESFAHIGLWDVVVSDGTERVRLELNVSERDARGVAGMVRSAMGIG